MRDDFAIFICTHGRPDCQHTYNALRKCGYSGKIYLVLDDTDGTVQQYIDNFGADSLIVFNKNHYINSDAFDNGTNEPKFKCIVYAKRAVEEMAKALNLNYFVIADDDMTDFMIRYPDGEKLATYKIHDMDKILSAYCDILSAGVTALGFGYITSYFLGINSFSDDNLSIRRLPYQFIIRNASKPVIWDSWFAEDDITELQSSYVGNLWISIPYIKQVTKIIGDTSGQGGMSDLYKQMDKYTLNFNIIKYCPHRVYFSERKGKLVISRRTNNCFPKLISDKYRKEV